MSQRLILLQRQSALVDLAREPVPLALPKVQAALGENDEVEFASHIDGKRVKLSPQIATRVQNQLGADIIMAFDECVSLPCTTQRMREAVDRSIRWAQQSLEAHQRKDQWMFGIVQGGTDRELRSYCCEELIKLDFPGYAIGGLSVGESHQEMVKTVGFLPTLIFLILWLTNYNSPFWELSPISLYIPPGVRTAAVGSPVSA